MLSLSVRGPASRVHLSRRSFVRTTLQTTGALCLPELLRRLAAAAEAGKPTRDTAVIQLWLGGGPSQLDMYDLKPSAPAEIRGPFNPAATNVPGLDICELLPLQARMMDRLAVVRSLHHLTHDHAAGMHWMQTGHSVTPTGVDSLQPTHPSLGSVVARLRGANQPGMVSYAHIAPDPLGYQIFLKLHEAAWLGSRYNPLRIESVRAVSDPNQPKLENLISKPQFTVPSLNLLPEMNVARLDDRARLRQHLNELGQNLNQPRVVQQYQPHQQQALQLLASPAAREAFDLDREDPKLRDRYGRNAWGQGLLLCRRLVEAGVTFVTLNTDSYSAQWDSHLNLPEQFQSMLPVYDQMLSALIEDLCQRGMYERVLVLVWGEFGRTPKISSGGRDHWGHAAFALMGGGGLRGGVVVGSTDAQGGEPKDRPLWPADILATVYHVLGIDRETELSDSMGRPIKVLSTGEPIRELI